MSLKIKKATHESRTRDKKRGRFILIIGNKIYHISKKEAIKLGKTIEGFIK